MRTELRNVGLQACLEACIEGQRGAGERGSGAGAGAGAAERGGTEQRDALASLGAALAADNEVVVSSSAHAARKACMATAAEQEEEEERLSVGREAVLRKQAHRPDVPPLVDAEVVWKMRADRSPPHSPPPRPRVHPLHFSVPFPSSPSSLTAWRPDVASSSQRLGVGLVFIGGGRLRGLLWGLLG